MLADRRTTLLAALGSFSCAAFVGGCGDRGQTPAPPPAAATAAVDTNAVVPPQPPAATAASVKDDVKIMKEFWEGTRILKFCYEMRRSASGKWDRNGMSQAYYASGKLEREGPYKDGKRVGNWTYYDDAGNVLRTENRGGG